MKKLFLTLLIPLFGLPAIAQDEVTSTPAGSLDFTGDDGITYTILDEQAKTCQTKAGYSSIDYDQRKMIFTYGNHITGDITIPASVENPSNSETYSVVAVGEYGFDSISSVTINEGITQIGAYAFMNNPALTSVSIPESVISIGRNAFYNCTALSNVNIPAGITSIEPYTFGYTGISSINIPESVVSIGDNAFNSCVSLTEVTIPGTVLQLGKSAFKDCTALTSLTIQEGITSIPSNAFSGCNALTTLTIPASVNSIGDYGFYSSGLTSITCYSRSIPAISANSFNSASYTNATLYVYKTVLSNYQNSQLWGQFTKIEPLELPATSVSISPSTLYVNVGLTGQLTATLEPADATGEITWALVSASPANCIEIDQYGLVTAKQIGTARVSASCGGQTTTCNVIVSANPDESVVINPPTGDIFIGNTLTLSAVVFPTTITPNLTWSSSNPEVATIDPQSGFLTALSDGGTVITATNDNVSGTLAITVKPIEATSITLDSESITLKVGGTQTLTATIQPENTTYKNITWDSNDPSVVVVADGVVTAVGVGSANVRAMVGSVTANCTVTVEPIVAESITLSTSSETLLIGQSLQLSATVSPENTTDKSVTWISDNAAVATVSSTGEVTALAQGTANITAECGNATVTCMITVQPVPSDQLVMNYTSVTLKIGGTQQLTAAVYPANTTDQTITWSSSDETVATVSNGLVTAMSVGTATITAQNGDQSATCTVTVEPILAEQIILSETVLTVNVGVPGSLTATVLPEETTDKSVVWTSLNEDIATVADGMVSGVAPGTAVITATCGSATASCTVTVLLPATSVTLNETSLDLKVGDIVDLIETVTPQNTTDVASWSSSDESVAIVDNNGIITALKAGNVTITVTYGSVSATCEVTVSDIAATSVELDYTELDLLSGQSHQLVATVLPLNTTFPVVTWASSDELVATVSEDGLVTAVGEGAAIITATCGDVMGQCSVTVTAPEPEQVVLNYQTYSLKAEQTIQLEVINPENVAANDVTWTSSNDNVATVSFEGLVTAVGVGEVTITASYNGSSAECSIVVNATAAESVVLDYSELTLEIEETMQLVASVLPTTTTDQTIVWSSNNTSVATVSEDGLVTAVGYGVATITAQCGNVYAMCLVTVPEDTESGVHAITSSMDDGYYRVYTLQGVNVMTTKEKSDLNNLTPGIYVINRHKVIIR